MFHARYATLLRPPHPGAIPKEGLLEVGFNRGITPSGRHAWGWAEYSRSLTPEEIDHYDLEYIHSYTLAKED